MKELKASIPDNWFTGTVETAWDYPYKEGIWTNNDTMPIFCLACVYYALLDISEAKSELTDCCNSFRAKYAKPIMAWIDIVKDRARADKRARWDDAPIITDKELFEIFEPWVEKWAVSSDKMLQWVVLKNVSNTLIPLIGLNRQELRGTVTFIV